MADTNWQKQASDKPLFPDVLWSRPENRRHAGKLLVIGGHSQSFSIASQAYTAASKAGAGHVRIVLPDSLQKTVGKVFPEAEFAHSTPIGSFSRKALGLLLELADWSDMVLLAGDLGKNSETAILLESFVDKYKGSLCLTGDSLDYFLQKPDSITNRSKTTCIASLSQAQKLAQPITLIKQSADFVQILDKLSIFSSQVKASLVVPVASQIVVAVSGKLSSTPTKDDGVGPGLAAYASVWQMQQPERAFEALTTAVYELRQASVY